MVPSYSIFATSLASTSTMSGAIPKVKPVKNAIKKPIKTPAVPAEVDPAEPKTWRLDDPFLWFHEEWYRKYHELPADAPIPGYPRSAASSHKAAGVKKLPNSKAKPCSTNLSGAAAKPTKEALIARPAANLTKKALIARLEDKKPLDVVQKLLKQKDPSFDEDWYTPYAHHFAPEDCGSVDDPFSLYLAKMDVEYEEELNGVVDSNANAQVQTSTASKQRKKKLSFSCSRRRGRKIVGTVKMD